MYRGFNVTLLESELDFENPIYDNKLEKVGAGLVAKHKNDVEVVFESFTDSKNEIDGSKMQANWFPIIDCDIFISHSHRDERLAIKLAGFLKEFFELDCFIDSCVWGYSKRLLKMIDKKYCYNDKSGFYDYESRNLSTSHVHMMLSTALSQMIDRCECVFFLNTPASMTPKDVIKGTHGSTLSPWIYSEIAMTRLIRKREPKDHREEKMLIKKSKLDELNEALASFNVRYPLNVDHLADFTSNNLAEWVESEPKNKFDALNKLYDLNPS